MSADVVEAALRGPYFADCRRCFDIERRFASTIDRDVWARQHLRDTTHRVVVGTHAEVVGMWLR